MELKLEQKVNDLEELTKIATTTLSEITHYTTVAIGPQVEKHTIVDIKFILLGARVLMAVILTDSGIIRESIIKFDEDIYGTIRKNIRFLYPPYFLPIFPMLFSQFWIHKTVKYQVFLQPAFVCTQHRPQDRSA